MRRRSTGPCRTVVTSAMATVEDAGRRRGAVFATVRGGAQYGDVRPGHADRQERDLEPAQEPHRERVGEGVGERLGEEHSDPPQRGRAAASVLTGGDPDKPICFAAAKIRSRRSAESWSGWP